MTAIKFIDFFEENPSSTTTEKTFPSTGKFII